jgi:hypothetical protein
MSSSLHFDAMEQAHRKMPTILRTFSLTAMYEESHLPKVMTISADREVHVVLAFGPQGWAGRYDTSFYPGVVMVDCVHQSR